VKSNAQLTSKVKTRLIPLLASLGMVANLAAQVHPVTGSAPSNPPLVAKQDEAIRKLLDHAYADATAGTGAKITTNRASGAPRSTAVSPLLTSPVTNRGAGLPTNSTRSNPSRPARSVSPTQAPGTAPTNALGNRVVPRTPSPTTGKVPDVAPGAAIPTNGAARPATAPSRPVGGATGPSPLPGAAAASGGETTPATVAGVPATVGASTNAPAAKDEEVFPPGLIKFVDTDVSQVLDIYQELTGRTVLRPATLPQAKITIKTQTELTRKEAVQALDSILSLNGITMVPQGDKFIKAVPEAQAGTAAREANTVPYENLPEAGSYVVQIVKLKNTAPRDVAQALQPFAKMPNAIIGLDASGIVILRDNAENVKRMMEVLEQIDIVPVREYDSVVIPIKYALASDIAQVLSSLTEGGSATTVGNQPNRSGLTPSGFGQRGTGTLSGLNQQQGQGYNQNTLGGLNSAGATRSSFQDRLRNIVRNAAAGGAGEITVLGETKIIADERTNSLLIFATKNDIKTIKEIVDKLDVVLPQVLIEAIIMEVSLNNNFQYGVSWLDRHTKIGNFNGAGGSVNGTSLQDPGSLSNPFAGTNNFLGSLSGFKYFGTFNDQFDMAVSAAESDSRINVLSRPRIQTSHAVEANLFVGETRPYITGTYFSGFGSTGSSSQYQQLQIGITLSVLPLINADGLVVMDIRQRIQNVGGSVTIDGNDVPITNDREANAKVAVHDRQTVILGGFISQDVDKSESGVPFLKDIPLLGYLFKGKSSQKTRRELIVLIRPTVLPTPLDAAQVAEEEKSKLPGVVEAERAMKIEEKKEAEKAERELRRQEGFKN
jgi:general secretion pathway protein D